MNRTFKRYRLRFAAASVCSWITPAQIGSQGISTLAPDERDVFNEFLKGLHVPPRRT